MYRRVVVYNSEFISDTIDVLYRVRGARALFQYRATTDNYPNNLVNALEMCAVCFADSIVLRFNTGIGFNRTYEFVLDVSENQTAVESVEEITKTGSSIVVFNESGVVVCRNDVNPPGEMTSEPIVAPGEMTSEPIVAPGEMTSEPIDGTGATI